MGKSQISTQLEVVVLQLKPEGRKALLVPIFTIVLNHVKLQQTCL